MKSTRVGDSIMKEGGFRNSARLSKQVEQKLADAGRLWQAREIEKAVAILEALAEQEEMPALEWA